MTLKRTHQYYYQVQCQLSVCEKEFCDFIVWTEVDFHAERINIDNEFCKTMLEKSELFFKHAILPELIGKIFSRPTLGTNTDVNLDTNLATGSALPVTQESCVDQSLSNCTTDKDSTEDNLIICTCRTVYRPDKDNVIACDNENCPYVWFHFKCVKIRRVPKGAWYCSKCRK